MKLHNLQQLSVIIRVSSEYRETDHIGSSTEYMEDDPCHLRTANAPNSVYVFFTWSTSLHSGYPLYNDDLQLENVKTEKKQDQITSLTASISSSWLLFHEAGKQARRNQENGPQRPRKLSPERECKLTDQNTYETNHNHVLGESHCAEDSLAMNGWKRSENVETNEERKGPIVEDETRLRSTTIFLNVFA